MCDSKREIPIKREREIAQIEVSERWTWIHNIIKGRRNWKRDRKYKRERKRYKICDSERGGGGGGEGGEKRIGTSHNGMMDVCLVFLV